MKRCFIENDPAMTNVTLLAIEKKYGTQVKEFFQHIVFNAHSNMNKVIEVIEECDEIYVETVYPIISGRSASMLDYLQEIAFQKEWKNKKIINVMPRGMMQYTELQLLRIEEAKKRNIFYLHFGDVIPGF